MKIPKDIESVAIKYDLIKKHNIIEMICRPWIAKKMNELMGAEEPAMINLVVHLLN